VKFPAEDWRNAQKSQILFKVQFDFLYPSISHYIFLNFNWFQFQENKLSNLWERKKRLLKSSGSIEKCLGMSEALLPTISGKFRKKFQPLIHEVKKRNFQCHQVFSDTYLCITMGLKFILREHFYFKEVSKVEKILKGSLDLIPSPSPPSVKIQIMDGKFSLKCKGNYWVLSTRFWKQRVCWHHPYYLKYFSRQ